MYAADKPNKELTELEKRFTAFDENEKAKKEEAKVEAKVT